ncbi:hypothetical protein F4780DRAFT_749952 [Xylariomycetidae sp. FL0641]|nr:hypothetical protein F4780DRAFT_749952 [Xylariomycetidae sp. FL0641]
MPAGLVVVVNRIAIPAWSWVVTLLTGETGQSFMKPPSQIRLDRSGISEPPGEAGQCLLPIACLFGIFVRRTRLVWRERVRPT